MITNKLASSLHMYKYRLVRKVNSNHVAIFTVPLVTRKYCHMYVYPSNIIMSSLSHAARHLVSNGIHTQIIKFTRPPLKVVIEG